jgi:hypothetical protein
MEENNGHVPVHLFERMRIFIYALKLGFIFGRIASRNAG